MKRPKPKFCRICWNVEQWSRPSGSAAAHETQSYVASHGFGHEEWLFNFEWMIDGHRNGFVQGIHNSISAYEGKTFPILLYTITPDRDHLAVAVIPNAYVPTEAELAVTLDHYRTRGWIDQMRVDLDRIGVPTSPLEDPAPKEIANVRFSPEGIRRFDPMPSFVPRERGAPSVTNRYTAFDWNGQLDCLTAPASAGFEPGTLPASDPRRSEAVRRRAAQQGCDIDPKHVRMQNLLYEALKKRHREVVYEENCIDLVGRDPDGTTYYELKTAPTAKLCLREAIGQLLEYAHYPPSRPPERLVVVGEAPASDEDRSYLVSLRGRFNMPIQYGWFRWEAGDLAPLV